MQRKFSSELKRLLTLWHKRAHPIDGQTFKRKKDETSTNKDPISQKERWGLFFLLAFDRI
jgi:hypothetical protein